MDAAMNWEATYSKVLRDVGFVTGKGCPCMFYHPQRNIRVTVHGDDFIILGQEKDLDWCRQCITSKLDRKVRGRIGLEYCDEKSIKLYIRVIEWSKDGISYDADQRHGEIIMMGLGLNMDSRGLDVPGNCDYRHHGDKI